MSDAYERSIDRRRFIHASGILSLGLKGGWAYSPGEGDSTE